MTVTATSTKSTSPWWVVAASTIGMSTGPSQYAFGSLALFIGPLSAEFGWDRTEISLAPTVFTITLLFSLPVAGRMADALGSKRLLIPSMLLVALLLAAIPLFVSESWHLWLIFGLIGSLGAGANALPYMRTVAALFNRQRGLAIGLTLAGAGLGYTYVPPLLRHVIDTYDWRSAYFVLAAIIIFIALPVVGLFFREAPDGSDSQNDSSPERAPAALVSFDRNKALRSPIFWNLFAIFGLLSFSLYGFMIHSVSLLQDRGMSANEAALGASTIGITIVIARVIIGYLCDRIFAPRVAVVTFAFSTIGLAIFASGAIDTGAFFALVLIGFSIGAEIDMMTYLTTRYFGIRHFGEIYGILFASLLIGTSLGPLLFGLSYDTDGSYVRILWVAAASTALATFLCFTLPQYSRVTGETK